ncbi:MAG TPA: hypothetical protein VGG45_10780 [Terracidiphilus sp.]|jgi:hypothetical protein
MSSTFDEQMERYSEPHKEPDTDAPRSTGYVASDDHEKANVAANTGTFSLTDALALLTQARTALRISDETLAVIEKSLTGKI